MQPHQALHLSNKHEHLVRIVQLGCDCCFWSQMSSVGFRFDKILCVLKEKVGAYFPMGGIAAVCRQWKLERKTAWEKEAAQGVCVTLCPAAQEPAADVHPSFAEVMFIKKLQKSLNGCDASGILSKAGVHWSGPAFKRCWLCSQISCTLFKMDCIVFTKAINACLDLYVFVALLLRAEGTASSSGRWELLRCSSRVEKTCLILAVEPFHHGSGVVTLGHGLCHGCSGRDGLLLLLYSLASCFGGMNKCLGDSCADPGHSWLGCNISSTMRNPVAVKTPVQDILCL